MNRVTRSKSGKEPLHEVETECPTCGKAKYKVNDFYKARKWVRCDCGRMAINCTLMKEQMRAEDKKDVAGKVHDCFKHEEGK